MNHTTSVLLLVFLVDERRRDGFKLGHVGFFEISSLCAHLIVGDYRARADRVGERASAINTSHMYDAMGVLAITLIQHVNRGNIRVYTRQTAQTDIVCVRIYVYLKSVCQIESN